MAAEGTEQGVQGALIYVWGGQWRDQLGRVCLQDPHLLPQTHSPLPRHTAQVLGRQAHTLTGHHGAGLEAICTGTFEASNDVGARAFPTGEPNGALVCVWGVVNAFREPPILDIILSASPLTATNWIGPGLVWL